MIRLATFLARIIPSLAQYFLWTFQAWHLAAAAAAIGVVLLLLDKILLLLAGIGALLLELVVRLGAVLLVYVLNVLPHVPEDWPSMAWGTIMAVLGPANRYVPVDVFFDYLGIAAALYASVLVYKLVKFIRGGG